ncbi:uncharacterized protein LOC131622508 [Vicia villosa]|uniref:uncharacterized protein LOC131622508 n=1 Tax=Vicia villosa TaxID=3911 RepID=UPI00273B15E5|nr:uncharacterized protein LOC131622508 [Vicia villosa]
MAWHKVGKRNFKNLTSKWDVSPVGSRLSEAKRNALTSIFFSEIPERITSSEIFELFGCVGDIIEVVISPRRNKFGKRFGFARFENVEDGRVLAVKLDNILIDGRKIHANLPRFSRSFQSRGSFGVEKAVGEAGKRSGGVPQKHNDGSTMRFSSFRNKEGSRSFVDAVKGGKYHCYLSYNSTEENLERFKRAFVGVIVNPGMSYNIQTSFEVEGYFSIKVTPLGANLCLLEDIDDGAVRDLIEEGRSWWSQWFSEIREWREDDVDRERATWLRVYGIPCHAWNFEFFEMIAKTVGTYVCVDDNTQKGEHMDIARILVKTPCMIALNESFSVCINGTVFKIKISEDSYGPMRINLFQKGKKIEDPSSSSESDFGWGASEFECGEGGEAFSASKVAESKEATVMDNRGLDVVLEDFQGEVTKGKSVSDRKLVKGDICFDSAVKVAREVSASGSINSGANLCCPGLKEKTDVYSVDTFFKENKRVDYKPLVKPKTNKMGVVKTLCGLKVGKKIRPKKRSLLKVDVGPVSGGNEGPDPSLKLDIAKRLSQLSESPILSPTSSNSVNNSFSAGNILCCDQVSDSDMIQGNSRFWDHLHSNVGEKLGDLISKLGVMDGDGNNDFRQKVAELELGDSKKKFGAKVIVNLDP